MKKRKGHSADDASPLANAIRASGEQYLKHTLANLPREEDWTSFWEAARGIFDEDPDLKQESQPVRSAVMRGPIPASAQRALQDEILHSAQAILNAGPPRGTPAAAAKIDGLRMAMACVIVSVCSAVAIKRQTLTKAALQLREMFSDSATLIARKRGASYRPAKTLTPQEAALREYMRLQAKTWRVANPGKFKSRGYRWLMEKARKDRQKSFKDVAAVRSWMNSRRIGL